jgi:hypothetical protein
MIVPPSSILIDVSRTFSDKSMALGASAVASTKVVYESDPNLRTGVS